MHHKHGNSRVWFFLVWATALVLWSVAAGYPRPVAADDAGPITEPPISSGAETGYPPFSVADENGRAGGFSVELLRAALSAMGHQATFRTGPWSQVRTWLEKGEVQVLPLVGRTPERETLFDFTVPYMTLHGTIVVREDQTGIRSLEDLAGRQVAVMKGDNAEEFLRRGAHGIRIQTTPTFEAALEELSRGLHDAVVIQRLVALRLIQKTGLTDLRLVEQPLEDFRQDFCFAVQEGDKDLLALLNEGLAIVMADGTYRRLHARWFAAMQLPTDRPILVGGDRNYPPYEFLDEKGRPAGFNVDLTRAIARETGIHVEIRLGRWPERVNALKTGKIDMIQGMFYSPARNLAFDFSPVHTVSHYVAVVRKGEGPAPESVEEIGEKRVVVERGDIMHDYILETAPQITPVLVDDQEAALGELAQGLHDCALVSRTTALYLMKKQGWANLVPGKKMLLAPEYCYAAAKGNKALLASFSEGLKALEASGEYRRIHEKWLGVYQEDPLSFTRVLWYSALVILPLLAVLAAAFAWSMALRRQVARKTGELKQSLDRIRHLNRVLRAIRGISRLIAREQGREHLIQKGCRLLVEGRGYLSALIVLTDDENTPALWAMEGLAGASEALRDLLSRGTLPHCCSRARPGTDILLVRRRDRVCTGCPLMSSCTRSQSMCTPLVHGDRLFGYLTVAAEDGQAIDEEEKGLFSEMAEDFAYALNTMRISDDRRQGRADLDKSEARFRLMVESAPEPIFIQTDHCFAYVNPKAVALFGAKEAGDLIGTPVIERCHPDYRESFIRRIRSLNRDRRPVEELLELRFLRLDGSEVWVETTGQPMQYDGRDGALVFVRDISLRKRHEQEHEKLSAQFLQAQKMESVGRLAGGVAHDYNNMLSVIIGFTELALAEAGADPVLKADLEEVLNAARRSADITRQLLAFARKQTIAPRVMDLNKTMKSMLRMLQRLIGEDIDLSWRPSPGLMPVFMDPSQLDQLVANLCVNARDAIRGVGKLTIETGRVRFDADYCDTHAGFIPGDFFMLAVSDDGCGMDKATLETIFEPFFTTKETGKGTGLGMSTVFGIVKQNKGFINVYSEPGKGTTVRVYLPPKDVVPDQEALPEATDIPVGNGETVLVVEDEASILNLAKKCLENLGYTVLAAATPTRAKADADRHTGKIHLLLTDVVMPEQNGRDLARDLRDRYPDLRVVFMSGYTANVIAHQGVLDDGVNFLQKPFSNRDLAVMVKKALDGCPPVSA